MPLAEECPIYSTYYASCHGPAFESPLEIFTVFSSRRTHSPFSTIVNLTHTRTTPPLHGTVAALLPSRSSPFSFHLFSIFTIGTRKSNFFSLWKVHSQSQLITAPPETFTTPIHQPIYYTLHPNRDQTINYARAFANASVSNRSPTCTDAFRNSY